MLKDDPKHLLCHNDKLAKCYFHSYFYLKYYSQVNLFEHRDKITLGIGCFRRRLIKTLIFNRTLHLTA